MPSAAARALAANLAARGGWQCDDRWYRVKGDGTCLLRTVAHFAKGNQGRFELVREELRKFMIDTPTAPFNDDDFPAEHRAAVRKFLEPGSREWGDHYHLQAAGELYQLRFELVREELR
eukprot:gene6044-38799_t